ncbi:23S rRNA (guanine(745)-N(1))-methyltransferase [Simiduia litorea]|uniref:putative RNA methyltransferase n=1 Tax=Simiduia litorea TaxID=1435348 RepID=UPI0036F40CF4
MGIWQCPVCAAPLQTTETGLNCVSGHQFDRAKEGYTNLLLANQKRRPDPGDNRDMLSARRDFLQAGHYQPLVDELLAQCAGGGDQGLLLDVGCGEGYYLDYLLHHLPQWRGAGIDISRQALRLAGKRNISNAQLCIASSKRIPVISGLFDSVITVFAPIDAAEIHRVLKEDGKFIRVTPGAEHLHELKAEIYQQVQHHEKAETPAGFSLYQQETVQFPMVFSDPQALENLLAMTPFVYKLDAKVRAALLARKSFTVQAEFCLAVYQKAPLNE